MEDKVKEYLLLHRNYAVSLDDIINGVGLEKEVILKILGDLSERGVIDYQINLNNKESKAYFKKYGKAIADGFEGALKQSR